MSTVSPEAQKKLKRLTVDMATKEGPSEAEQHQDLQKRIAVSSGKDPEPQKSEENVEKASDIISMDEALIEKRRELAEIEGTLLEDLKVKIDADPLFARLVLTTLQERRLAPRPPWYKGVDMFNAYLDLGGGNKVSITVASYGHRTKSLLSTRALRIQQELSKIDKEVEACEGETRDEKIANLPIGMITERNALIGQIGMLQQIANYAGMITGWEGPMFQWSYDHDSNRSRKGETFPNLASLSLDDETQKKTAISIMESLPQKLLEMINTALKILQSEGVEDDWAQGN